MLRGQLTREEAIKLVGKEPVKAAEGESCEPTNRAGYNGACQGDELIEWAATVDCINNSGDDVQLVIYYYTDRKQEETAKDNGWDFISWEVEGFEIY